MAKPARLTLLTLPLLALCLVLPASAGAAPPKRWIKLAGHIGEPWPGEQRPDGSFHDYLKPAGSRYGEAALGYALIQTGLRTGSRRDIESGLRALNWAVRRTRLQIAEPSVFEHMAVASAYNVARRRLRGYSLFRNHKRRWVAYLKRIRTTKLSKQGRYGNHYLPEAIAVLELSKSGLRARGDRAILGGDRGRAKRLAKRLINVRIPRFARQKRVFVRGDRAFILSDPPDDPPTYQGFSLGLYARAVDRLGGSASRGARETLRQIVHASWALAAPDGDLGYFGRSQSVAWTLSMTAYGAELAARLPGSSTREDRRYHALAERALARLRDEYGNGPDGLYVIPALRASLKVGPRGRDGYTGAVSFSGMTLMSLNWAFERMQGNRRIGGLASDVDGASRLSRGVGTFAVVRRGDVWFTVRKTLSRPRIHHPNPNDLRLDFGLHTAKVREGGIWRYLVRLRPKTDYTKPDSAGPVLRRGGRVGLPFGDRMRVSRRGTVVVVGGFRTPGGRTLRRGVRFTFQPVACGVRVTFPARRGDRIEYSVFFRNAKQLPEVVGNDVFDRDQRVSTSLRGGVTFDTGYSSGVDPALDRARIRFTPDRGQTLVIKHCRP